MKKRIFAALMSLAMAASLLSTAVAAPITPEDPENPNQYVITDALQNFEATDDLWIGTLADWKAEGKAVGSTGTVFENGEAIHEDDIIITNGKVGAVLAVGTRNPWGYPAGSVLDVGAVENWVGDRDTVWSVEALINGWDFWAPDNCGTVTFDVVKYNFDPAVKAEAEDGQWAVKVSRIYDDSANGVSFAVDTYYGISPDANYIMMFDKLANTSGKDTHKVSNRFALTNKGDDGGAMYDSMDLSAIGTYGNTDKNVYSTSYVMPGQNVSNLGVAHALGKIGGSVGYKELRAGDGGKQVYLKDEVVTFDEYIIVSDEPTTEAVSDFLIDYNDATPVTVSGTAKDADGKALANPVVVVKKDDASYAWFMGEADGTFSFQLPEGDDFTAYIEQNGYAKGEKVAITDAALELAAGEAKVDVTFNLKDQNGEPVYGKLELFVPDGADGWKSAYPTVRFCGDSVYQAQEEGVIHAQITPGQYKAVVFGEGYWFYSDPVEVIANTADGAQDVTVNMVYNAPEGWVSGDLHHHANKNDAFADPKDAIPSLKAAGLDVGFITDHDFTVNNAKAFELAKQYDLFGFIPSEEISCSWAHFNVIPQDPASWEYFLDENAENHVMNQFGKLPEFVQQTIDKGASITANHPWYSYGLYYSMDAEKVPGGYTDEYGNIEINACSEDSENLETILSAIAMWTSYQDGTSVYNDINGTPVITEKAHYIIGGSDTHDVLYPGFAADAEGGDYSNARAGAWYASGKIRTFAYVGDTTGTDVTANGLAFANAVVNGHTYTTYGPILTLDQIPGNEYDVDGTFALTVGVESLANVKDIVVLTKNSADSYAGLGTSAYTEQQLKCDADLSTFGVNAKTGEFTIEVDVARGQQDWVAVLVVDENGNYAITSPYWLTGTGDYSDVDAQHWAYANVMDVAEKGLMNGVGDGSVFAPATELTRGMAATVLYRMSGAEGGNAAEAAATFSDVAADKWYAEAIDWASDNKIAQGDGAAFRPNDTITRQDMVTMLYRYAQFTGADVSAVNDLAAFTDAGSVASYADAAVKWAVGAGIINGRTDTTLVPGGALNRAEFAAIISRYTK